MNAVPMVTRCVERQRPDIPLDVKAVMALGEPSWIILWRAYVVRTQTILPNGRVDGPPRTWLMVVK